jgi:GNAT superfamily N-acetyltransferase
MTDLTQDFSTTNIISAIENNLFGAMLAFGKWPRIEVHDQEEILWSISDIPFALFNSVLRARLTADQIDAAIEARIAQGKTRQVPLLWWTSPATQPPDLEDYLERHGFIHEGHMPGMAVVLARLAEDFSNPPGLIIREVNDPSTLKLWSQTCGEGFGLPEFAVEGFYDLMTHAGGDRMRAYLGWLDGEPVATSLLVLEAGAAGIYNVTTIPAARRKGIGAAMTYLPLQEAKAAGYRLGILNASEMGVGVYRSLGFQEYCKIGQYVWAPGLEP